jgi:hypothetical protein
MEPEPFQLPQLLQKLHRAHKIHGGAISGTCRFRFDDSEILLRHFLPEASFNVPDVIAFYVEDRDNYCCEVSVSLLTEAEFENWRRLVDFRQPFDFEIVEGLWVSGVSAEPRRFQNPNCRPGHHKMLVCSNRSMARLRPYVNFRYRIFICPRS